MSKPYNPPKWSNEDRNILISLLENFSEKSYGKLDEFVAAFNARSNVFRSVGAVIFMARTLADSGVSSATAESAVKTLRNWYRVATQEHATRISKKKETTMTKKKTPAFRRTMRPLIDALPPGFKVEDWVYGKEAASMTGWSSSWIQQCSHKGTVRAVSLNYRTGKHFAKAYNREDVLKLIPGHKIQTTKPTAVPQVMAAPVKPTSSNAVIETPNQRMFRYMRAVKDNTLTLDEVMQLLSEK